MVQLRWVCRVVQRVFVDANVFVSRTLRDWVCLLRAELPGVFQLHTTEDVLAETISTLGRLHPDRDGAATSRLRSAILGSIDELVDDFSCSVPWAGDDPKDRHVHAAAVSSGADVLLSEDRGFRTKETPPYEVLRCDEFFLLVDDAAPWAVRGVALRQLAYWSSRPGTRTSLGEALASAGCEAFGERVGRHIRAAGLERAPRRDVRAARPDRL